MRAKVYELSENGRIVGKDTAPRLGEIFGFSATALYCCVRDKRKLLGKYDIRQVGFEDVKRRKEYIQPPCEKQIQKKLESIRWHLQYCGGITTVKGNPEIYVRELEKEGIQVTYRKSVFGRNDYILETT